jgi:hypothetical protein
LSITGASAARDATITIRARTAPPGATALPPRPHHLPGITPPGSGGRSLRCSPTAAASRARRAQDRFKIQIKPAAAAKNLLK